MRLGEFHTGMSFMAVLGKRFSDAGLRHILIEAEVVAQGSINAVLNGHHYNRSIRAHKLLYESLHRLRFQTYLDSLEEVEANRILIILTDLDVLFPSESFSACCDTADFKNIVDQYEEFVVVTSRQNPTFAFWSSYIEMVQILES